MVLCEHEYLSTSGNKNIMSYIGPVGVNRETWVYYTCPECDWEGETVPMEDRNAVEQEKCKHDCDNKNLNQHEFDMFYGYCYTCGWSMDDAEMTYKDMFDIVVAHTNDEHPA